MKPAFTTLAVPTRRVGVARRAIAAIGVTCTVGLVAVTGNTASAGEPKFSARYICPDSLPEMVVTLGGDDPDTFDIYFNDVKVTITPLTADSSLGTAVAGDGQYDVIVRNSVTDEVVFVQSVFVGCDAPYLTIAGSCPDGEGQVTVTVTDNEPLYRYDVLIDGVPVIGFLDLDVTDLAQERFDITGVESGTHVVTVNWSESATLVDSQNGTVVISCPGDGSGTPLPDSGSNSTPLVLAAGLLVAAGLGMLGLRRRTA